MNRELTFTVVGGRGDVLFDLLLLVARGCGHHYGGHHRLTGIRCLVDGTVADRHHALAHIPLRPNEDNVQLWMGGRSTRTGQDLIGSLAAVPHNLLSHLSCIERENGNGINKRCTAAPTIRRRRRLGRKLECKTFQIKFSRQA